MSNPTVVERGRTVVRITQTADGFILGFGWWNKAHTKLRETSFKISSKAYSMLQDAMEFRDYENDIESLTPPKKVMD